MAHHQQAVMVGGRRYSVSTKPRIVPNQEHSTTPELSEPVDYPRPTPSIGQTASNREKEKRQGFDEFHKEVKHNEEVQHQTDISPSAKYRNLPKPEHNFGGRIYQPAGKGLEA